MSTRSGGPNRAFEGTILHPMHCPTSRHRLHRDRELSVRRLVAGLLVGCVLCGCSDQDAEPAPTARISGSTVADPEPPFDGPVNHEPITQDSLRSECLQATADSRHPQAVSVCRQLVERSRNPFNVASLANALAQFAIQGGAGPTALSEARRLIGEALHSAPGHPQADLWVEPAWSIAVEIHAASGERAEMEAALRHLTWDSPEEETADRAYYEQLLRRARR